MARRGYKGRIVRLAAALAIGGSAFNLSGCDPLVRDTFLTGLEATTNALTDTLVTAFFISLQDDDSTSDVTGLTTGIQ
ncbi:MAG: hypothetical protein JSV19_08260 [Phycisphaerales bacterium]|nr:MAG: hypothetical protein JSV19_08260 [Phycisphaerales bacterium]